MLGSLDIANSVREVGIPFRNVVIEMSRKELLVQDVNGFEKLESFKVTHHLRQDAHFLRWNLQHPTKVGSELERPHWSGWIRDGATSLKRE
jgi:hypothetical protein